MLAHNYALPPWVGLAITLIVCGGAFWKGGREEQLAAVGLMLSTLATVFLSDRRWGGGPQWSAFAADTCLLVLLTWIALRTRRYWPFLAAAFQLLCVAIHIARIVDPGVRAWAYATGQVILSQWVFFAVGVGTINTWRASRQPAIEGEPIAEPIGDPGATLR